MNTTRKQTSGLPLSQKFAKLAQAVTAALVLSGALAPSMTYAGPSQPTPSPTPTSTPTPGTEVKPSLNVGPNGGVMPSAVIVTPQAKVIISVPEIHPAPVPPVPAIRADITFPANPAAPAPDPTKPSVDMSGGPRR